MVSGWGQEKLPGWSVGYLYLPAFGAIIITTLLFAPLGARLAHTIPAPLLKRGFALFLAILGLAMLWKAEW